MRTKRKKLKKKYQNRKKYSMQRQNSTNMLRSKAAHMFKLIMDDDSECVKSLIQTDVQISTALDVTFVDADDGLNSNTFLRYAVKENRTNIVKILLLAGSPVDSNLKNITDNVSIIRMLDIFSDRNLTMEEKSMMLNRPIVERGFSLSQIRRERRERQQMKNIVEGTSKMTLTRKRGGSKAKKYLPDSFLDSVNDMKIGKKRPKKKKSISARKKYKRVTRRDPNKKYNLDLSKFVDDLLNVGPDYIGSEDNLSDALEDMQM